jgi:hypothetical protein
MARVAKFGDLGERLPREAPRPQRLDRFKIVGCVAPKEFKQVVTRRRCEPQDPLTFLRRRSIDGEKAEILIEYLHESAGGLEQFGKQLSFGQASAIRCSSVSFNSRKSASARTRSVTSDPSTKMPVI